MPKRLMIFAICLMMVTQASADAGEVAGFGKLDVECDATRKHCIDVHVHISVTADGPVQTPDWLATQLSHANRLFETIDVGFRLASVQDMPADSARVHSRLDRDLLGRNRWHLGAISIFVVEYLANVDEKGQIYGVHWRDREETSHRWIILSSIAWEFTLAHELGHFFGLKHCSHKGSIMNKTGKERLPMNERGFARQEVETMRRRLKRMSKKKYLVPAAESKEK